MPIKIVCKDIVNSDIIVTGKAWSLSQICQMISLCVHGWKPLSEACPSAHVHSARLLDDQITQPGGVSAFKSTAVFSCSSSGDMIELTPSLSSSIFQKQCAKLGQISSTLHMQRDCKAVMSREQGRLQRFQSCQLCVNLFFYCSLLSLEM